METEAKEKKLNAKQYEELAEWGERFALVVFGSLVVQQLVNDASTLVVGTGMVVTVASYLFAYKALKKAK